jgi:hypothetical protein
MFKPGQIANLEPAGNIALTLQSVPFSGSQMTDKVVKE